MLAACVAAVNHVAEDPEFVRELDNFLNIYSPVVKRQGAEFKAALTLFRNDFDERVIDRLLALNMNFIQTSIKITRALKKSGVFLNEIFNHPRLRDIVFEDHFRAYFLRASVEVRCIKLVDPALIQNSRPSSLVTLSRYGPTLFAHVRKSLIEVPNDAARQELLRVAHLDNREIALFRDKIWTTNEPGNEELPRIWTTEQGGVVLQMEEQFIYAGKAFRITVNNQGLVSLEIKFQSINIAHILVDVAPFDTNQQTRRVWLLPPGPTGLFIKVVVRNNNCQCAGDGTTLCGCLAELRAIRFNNLNEEVSILSPYFSQTLTLSMPILNFAINPLQQLPLTANCNDNAQIRLDGSRFAVCSVLGGRRAITLKIPIDFDVATYLRSAVAFSDRQICLLGNNATIFHLSVHMPD